MFQVHWRDHQFHTDIWRRDVHETSNLVRGGGHTHLQHSQIVIIRLVSTADHLQNGEWQAEVVVIIAFTLQYAMVCAGKNVSRQFFGGCLARAASDTDYRFSPLLIHFSRQRL